MNMQEQMDMLIDRLEKEENMDETIYKALIKMRSLLMKAEHDRDRYKREIKRLKSIIEYNVNEYKLKKF